MATETEELREQAIKRAPKEFTEVKRRRNYVGGTVFAFLVLWAIMFNSIFRHATGGPGILCIPLVGISFAILAGLIMRRSMKWECPVCHKSPGPAYTNPRFCKECGVKLEE